MQSPFQRHPQSHRIQRHTPGRRMNINDEFEAFSQFYLPWSRFCGLLRVPLDELNGTRLRVVLSRT